MEKGMLSIKQPKIIAEIKICGVLHLCIDDTMDWKPPTEEQIKNLHDALNIDVIVY